MPQAFLNQLELAVGAAEHGDFRKRARLPVMPQPLRLQHVYAAGHAADLLCNAYALGKVVRRTDQAHGGTRRAVGRKGAGGAGIAADYG